MQTIQLHLYEKPQLPVICATQGDVGRKFQAVITDGSLLYTIPTDAAFTLWYSGTSGEGNYAFIGDSSAFQVDGDTVTVELITQMLACPGGGELCLCMSRPDGTWLGLWNIPYQVDALPGSDSPEAVQSYTAFSDSVAKLQQAAEKIIPDDTLSQQGRPADAAAVGLALAEKAPAGFGLGGASVTEKESADECMSIGWYKVQNGGIYGDGDSCYIHTVAFGIDGGIINLMQEGYRIGWNYTANKMDYIKACRFYDGAEGWSPWEYENPPMTAGMEFRTTRRYLGRPVYCKLVSCGNVIAGTPAAVNYGGDICRPIRVGGGVSSGLALQTGLATTVVNDAVSNQTQKMEFGGYLNYVTILPGITLSNVQVIVEYYKTTD